MRKLLTNLERKISKNYLRVISLLVLLTLPQSLVNGCSFGPDEDDAYVSLFAPETSGSIDFTPFFFSFHELYRMPTNYNESGNSVFTDQNLTEWSGYFTSKLSTDEIRSILYSCTQQEVEHDLSEAIKGHTPKKYLLVKSMAVPFLNYLWLSKKIEEIAYVYKYENWEAVYKTTDANKSSKLIGEIKRAYAREKNSFLKQRYAYQLLRTYFYSLQFNDCIAFYNEAKELGTSPDYLHYMSLRYLNGAYYRTKNYAKANFTAAILFDEFPLARPEALRFFHPQEESDWQQTLTLAKTKKEKIAIWNLFGYYADPLTAINTIYSLDPHSEYMIPLLTRVVNILELHHLNTDNDLMSYDRFKNQKLNDASDIKRAMILAERIITEKQIPNIPFWQTTLAYLQFLNIDYPTALKTLHSINTNEIRHDSLLQGQIRIIRVASIVFGSPIITSAVEEQISDDFKWLGSTTSFEMLDGNIYYGMDPEVQILRRYHAFLTCKKELERKYRLQDGAGMKAELCTSRKCKFESIDEIQNVLKYFDQPHSQFETILLSQYPVRKVDLIELWALKLAYSGHLTEARMKMEEVKEAGHVVLLGNPFNSRIVDCHDCDHQLALKTKYTKYMFIKKMIEMDSIASHNPKEASINYMLMGVGFYNISYYGNARLFYDTKFTSASSNYYFYENDNEPKEEQYYSNEWAKQYFLKAMNAATDIDMKAKCCWLLAKTELNTYYTEGHSDFMSPPNSDILVGEYFLKMKSEYANTKYYDEVIKECSYFAKYVSRR